MKKCPDYWVHFRDHGGRSLALLCLACMFVAGDFCVAAWHFIPGSCLGSVQVEFGVRV